MLSHCKNIQRSQFGCSFALTLLKNKLYFFYQTHIEPFGYIQHLRVGTNNEKSKE